MRQPVGRLTSSLHIFVLTSFALAQPLFDRLSSNRTFLVDQSVGVGPLVLLLLSVSVLIPSIIVLAEMVVAVWSDRGRTRLHVGLVSVLSAAIVVPIVAPVPLLPGIMSVALALAVAAGFVFGYTRYSPVRTLVTAASPALLVFPVVFLCRAPIAGILFPHDRPDDLRTEVRHAAPVVVLVFDEFCGTSLMDETRGIDRVRYPHFAAFAGGATWFRNATSVHWRTLSAVPAILTGTYPTSSGSGTLAEHPTNLFTILSSSGAYDLVAFEPVTRLFPGSGTEVADPDDVVAQFGSLISVLSVVYLHHLSPADLRPLLPRIPREWFGLRDTSEVPRSRRTGVMRYGWNRDRDQQFEHFLECIEPGDKPALFFAHVVLPHFPWCYLPSGRKYAPDNGSEMEPLGAEGAQSEAWGSDEFAVRQGYQRYLLQVGYCDYLLGRLIDRLKAADLYEPSLIIVTADHGVAFHATQSRRAPTDASLADIMSVPLFIKTPGQQDGKVSDRNVEQIDVLPTVLDELGIEPAVETAGSSLLDLAQPERPQKIFYGDNNRFTVDARFESRYETLDQMLGYFGTGDHDLFAMGPHEDLVGRRVDAISVGERSTVRIELNRSRFIFQDTGLVPAFVKGVVRVDRDTELPIHLAIAVNGTIRAVTRTYLSPDARDVWSAMLPETCFREGENRVDVFTVSPGADGLVLQPCPLVE